MADVVHDDLAWDYTGESLENSPLIADNTRNSPMTSYFNFSKDASYKITRRQAEYLLQNMEDGASFMKSYILAETSGGMQHLQRGSKLKKCLFLMGSHNLIITFILQVLNVAILVVLDGASNTETREEILRISEAVMLSLQLLNFLLIVLINVKMMRKLVIHNLTGIFIAQAYLSTLLMFAGIYTTTFRFDEKSWKFVDEPLQPNNRWNIVLVYVKMLFLSISTGTLCGNAVIVPNSWYNYMFQAFEMLVSFVYFASILSQLYASQARIPRGAPEEFVQVPRRLRRGSLTSQNSLPTGGNYGTMDSPHV
ncbi:uncharacterized protein LOC141908272 isoform X2 [Tubulanus polymorphus]|uniref:uncharacterized protein LOC141908272 isoform X2 n=1 Tax=Tubulanus polymorphus TaxID=672921 RepID=UPI003DA3B257